MKKSLTIFMAAVSLVMSFGVTSCSDDNDEPNYGSVAGTSWVVKNCIRELSKNSEKLDEELDTDYELIGRTITFLETSQNEGFLIISPAFLPAWCSDTMEWEQNVASLRIGFNRGTNYEIEMNGGIMITGKRATFKYIKYKRIWTAFGLEWVKDGKYTMTLERV